MPLEILVRLQLWISADFKQLSPSLQSDSSGRQYLEVCVSCVFDIHCMLQVSRTSAHQVLVTLPSLRLVCRVTETRGLVCVLYSYNALVIREVRQIQHIQIKNPNKSTTGGGSPGQRGNQQGAEITAADHGHPHHQYMQVDGVVPGAAGPSTI